MILLMNFSHIFVLYTMKICAHVGQHKYFGYFSVIYVNYIFDFDEEFFNCVHIRGKQSVLTDLIDKFANTIKFCNLVLSRNGWY